MATNLREEVVGLKIKGPEVVQSSQEVIQERNLKFLRHLQYLNQNQLLTGV